MCSYQKHEIEKQHYEEEMQGETDSESDQRLPLLMASIIQQHLQGSQLGFELQPHE